ncbi:MAG: efflux RND transporter periplasmic adaptor subunit [Prevotella sp.]|nr:efflux RND transporter periplasmic adaptor subunit [Prevotella sp.]
MFILSGCTGRNAQQTEEDAVKFQVSEVKAQAISTTVSYPATMRGRQDIAILPQIEGKIQKVMVAEGQRVSRGQVLFVIDQVGYRAALNTARANVQAAMARVHNARLTWQSKRQLHEQRVVSDFDVSQAANSLAEAKAQLEQTRAELANARNNLSYTLVKSPSDGVVGTLPYKTGALVSASMTTPLTTVSENDQMYAYFSLNEKQITQLLHQYGSKEEAIRNMPDVSWQMSDGALYEAKGRVATISGILDSNTGTVSVRAAFANPRQLLLSGATGNVLMTTRIPRAVVIPQTAVNVYQDQLVAYRVVGGRAKATVITVYPQDDGKRYVVKSGLKPGDRIITTGVNRVQDNMPL